MKLNKGQRLFVVFLAVLTIASIVAEFAGHHETAAGAPASGTGAHETGAGHAEAVEHSEASHKEAHVAPSHWWSGIPMFWIWFGALGCAVLILFAKKILGPFIYKKEDYYNE